MTRPVFLLSLPRAGSTLLQRLLLASGRCATLGEPSLLLRLLAAGDAIDRRSTYWESLVDTAIEDMRGAWTGYDDCYRQGVRDLMSGIYQGLADGKEWFLDKTPRYTLIAEEIYQTFPDARFIVLWRHPLAVASSLSTTFSKGRWSLDEFGIDLYHGMDCLRKFCDDHSDSICEIRYEDLVENPAAELKRIGDYLGWEGLEEVAEQDLVSSVGGRMGDPTGVKKYHKVSAASREAWKKNINNWYRRNWAKSYYREDRSKWLEDMDYHLPDELLDAPWWQGSVASGFVDFLSARRRAYRHLRHPTWLPRFARKFRKKHGYEVGFR